MHVEPDLVAGVVGPVEADACGREDGSDEPRWSRRRVDFVTDRCKAQGTVARRARCPGRDLTGVIDVAATEDEPSECRIDERVKRSHPVGVGKDEARRESLTDNVTRIVDPRRPVEAASPTEDHHSDAVGVAEDPLDVPTGARHMACHLAGFVDGIAPAVQETCRHSEIGECVPGDPKGPAAAPPGDLTGVVYCLGLAVAPWREVDEARHVVELEGVYGEDPRRCRSTRRSRPHG